MPNLLAVHGDRRTAHSLHHCSHVSPLSRHQLPTHSSTTGLQREWCRLWLTLRAFPLYFHCSFPGRGDIAQLGERLHGMQEVGGSSPPISTIVLPTSQPASKLTLGPEWARLSTVVLDPRF